MNWTQYLQAALILATPIGLVMLLVFGLTLDAYRNWQTKKHEKDIDPKGWGK